MEASGTSPSGGINLAGNSQGAASIMTVFRSIITIMHKMDGMTTVVITITHLFAAGEFVQVAINNLFGKNENMSATQTDV